jgi:hypothetical protein
VSSKRRHPKPAKDSIERKEDKIVSLLETDIRELRIIERQLFHPTPTAVCFKETSMLPADPGNVLVFTGVISPDGATFPAGTTFSVTASDPNVIPTVDATGLVVTIPIPATATPGESLTITWQTSTFAPSPATSPASLQATIDLTVGSAPPPAATPTAVVFNQTT